MTIDRNHHIYLIAESTNREVIEDMIRSLDYLDAVDGPYKTTDGKHVLVLWNTEDERRRIRSWASHRYPASLYYGIQFDETAKFEHIRYLREEGR
jgi:hypothetical protein